MTVLTDDERATWERAVPEAQLNQTDAGNGEHFARLYGDRVRYDHRRKRWLIWAGDWWRPDDAGQVRVLAKEAARDRYGKAMAIDDLEDRRRESTFAIRSENRQRLEAMLVAAQTEAPVADAGDRWDEQSFLLGVANGVIDLRTGRLRAGRPEDRITTHSDVRYDRDACCPRWERFLGEVFCGDELLVDYIRRAIGYSLTGDTSDQSVFMGIGSGSNGKSVLLTILRALGGGYAANTPFATFEDGSRAGIPNDVAALVGRRIVTASEVNEGTRLNEARLKALTGGDFVTARFLHGEFFDFQPVLKLWLGVNHRPVVRDDSYGFWRRVRLIPFNRQFTKDADPGLIDHLRLELPGILTWAVQGALDWQRDGLEPPLIVSTATDSYRADSDPVGEFLASRCVVRPECEVGASAFFASYRSWANDAGLSGREVLNSRSFGELMAGRFQRQKRNSGAFYVGIGLLAEYPDGIYG